MSKYLRKYVGTYRVLAEYDIGTNDFPRDENGDIDSSFDDLYIPCKWNGKIFHQQKNVLMCYLPSLIIGNRVVKNIMAEYPDVIGEVRTTDCEVTFTFKAKDIGIVAKYVQPKTAGSNISPFSIKNLPKTPYKIPEDDLKKYKNLIKDIPLSGTCKIGKLLREFEKQSMSEGETEEHLKATKRKLGLKGKEYIHSLGRWDDFIEFLSKNL